MGRAAACCHAVANPMAGPWRTVPFLAVRIELAHAEAARFEVGLMTTGLIPLAQWEIRPLEFDRRRVDRSGLARWMEATPRSVGRLGLAFLDSMTRSSWRLAPLRRLSRSRRWGRMEWTDPVTEALRGRSRRALIPRSARERLVQNRPAISLRNRRTGLFEFAEFDPVETVILRR
jgi:hypothetical protein